MTDAHTEKKGTILIAEDERPMAKALKLKFESEGYAVDTAHDGDEALAAATKNTYDAILLDVIMPKKNGFEILKVLNDTDKLMPPVFVLSNLSQEEDRDKALKLGAEEFIIKSNTPIADVIDRVTAYL